MKMGYLLIVAGLIVAGIGAVLVFRGQKDEEQVIQTQHLTSQLVQEETPQTVPQVESKEEEKPAQTAVNTQPEEKPAEQEKTAKEKGNDFEEVLADIFKKNHIRILEWNQGTVTGSGAMGENALKPDFFLVQEMNGKQIQYWIEAKYRSNIGQTFSLEEYQIERYKKHQRDSKRKIIIAIGEGGSPSAPRSFYFVPLDSLKDGKITRDDLKHFYLSNPQRDFPGRMERWFLNEVFKKKDSK